MDPLANYEIIRNLYASDEVESNSDAIDRFEKKLHLHTSSTQFVTLP